MSSSNRLRLSTRRDIERRLYELYWLLRNEYPDIRVEGEKTLDPYMLYTTQLFLESDKLGVVLKKTLLEGYNVPIIVIRGSMGRLYILDGHHRARVALWLRTLVKAYVLNTPRYKPRLETIPLTRIEFINPPISVEDPVINLWRHMVNIIHFLEKKHKRIAFVSRDKVELGKLYVTQKKPVIRKLPEQVLDEPILVYSYHGEYYLIDGHTRACLKLLNGSREVLAVAFTLNKAIGIMDTAKKLGYQRLTSTWCTTTS